MVNKKPGGAFQGLIPRRPSLSGLEQKFHGLSHGPVPTRRAGDPARGATHFRNGVRRSHGKPCLPHERQVHEVVAHDGGLGGLDAEPPHRIRSAQPCLRLTVEPLTAQMGDGGGLGDHFQPLGREQPLHAVADPSGRHQNLFHI